MRFAEFRNTWSDLTSEAYVEQLRALCQGNEDYMDVTNLILHPNLGSANCVGMSLGKALRFANRYSPFCVRVDTDGDYFVLEQLPDQDKIVRIWTFYGDTDYGPTRTAE